MRARSPAFAPIPGWNAACFVLASMGNELDLDALCRKDPDERLSLHAGKVIAGSYLVDRVLGVGGMGTVVAARSLTTGELVAIKFMLPHCAEHDPLMVRFQREARATERLKSAHVGRVLATGEVAANMPFIVMEYLDGEDLKSLVKREGPLEPRQAAAYVSQACDALAEAHALGIVHRDLKPANLFLARQPRGPSIIKVLDFGVAKFDSPNVAGDHEDVTATHAMVGTHHYMAPEQIVSPHAVTALADVWALGAILHFLLTGKTPFEAPTRAEVLVNVLREPPHPLEELRPSVPPRLNAIVRRCLEKDREKRYPNATELARELEPLARHHHGGAALNHLRPSNALTRTERILVHVPEAPERVSRSRPIPSGRAMRRDRVREAPGREALPLRTRALMACGALGAMLMGGLLAVVAMPERTTVPAEAAAAQASPMKASEEASRAVTAQELGAAGVEDAVAKGGGGAGGGEEDGGFREADAAAIHADPGLQEVGAVPGQARPGKEGRRREGGPGSTAKGVPREAQFQMPSAAPRRVGEGTLIFEFRK